MEKRSRLRRLRGLPGFIVFRIVPILLIVGILWTGYQVAQGLERRVDEQNEASQRQPNYVQTATAMASPQATEAANRQSDIVLAAYRQNNVNYQFETNTPLPPAPTEAEPTVEATLAPVTPRPLPTLFMFNGTPAESAGGTAVPSAVPTLDRNGENLLNVLLLGNDGEVTDDGYLRTDTMIVVSINRDTGTVSMISFPRDMYVYIPGWTMQRLNLAYIHGEQGGWPGGGFGLLRQTLLYNFGLNVHYYAMVDFSGFKSIVDAVGGINVAVDCAIEDLPLIDTQIPSGAYKTADGDHWVLPVGYYQMTGAEALWYARSRASSTDFDRGRRQQQVLRAVWNKAKATGLLNNAVQLWNDGSQYVQTDMQLQDILSLLPIALNLDPGKIQDYEMARTYDTLPWQPPDGSNVQLPVYDHLHQLLQDFYTPPTQNQLVAQKATISVYNGTTNPNWDKVAVERLTEDGFAAIAAGPADKTDYADTVLIDHTGRSKGSSAPDIAKSLNIKSSNVQSAPDPNRTVDYEVILGTNYNSCTTQGLLPVDPNPAATAPADSQ
ncbi:MAG TPA: LCP family protein [Phototrophicaceae bacterium]|nr:LCP family protein [Phototrophicaceae bacterium]